MNVSIRYLLYAALASSVLLVACQSDTGEEPGNPVTQAADNSEKPAPAAHQQDTTGEQPDAIDTALNLSARTDADRQRDQGSKPAEVLGLLDLMPGQTVMDIFAGGGYYSEIMANIVGAEGKVLLHNNQAYRDFIKDELSERKQRLALPQLEYYDREVDDFGLSDNSLDAAMIIMSYHDLYYADPENGWAAIDSQDFLGQVGNALKPGGRFLIVDHAAAAGSGKTHAQTLHRIEESFAVQDIENNGFKLIGSSDALRNSEDDKTIIVFDDAIRGKTDRFILLFEKSAD